MSETRIGRRAVFGAALLIAAAMGVGALLWAGQSGKAPEATSHTGELPRERLELVTGSGTHVLDVEIAETPQEQALGLMFRTGLPDDQGMLFPHKTPRELTMWMRNTYIPLDMVFILADGTVHRIEARTEPFSERIIASEGEVSAVLEIAGGAAARLGLKPGDKVRHRIFGTDPER